jgi:hypothetical protein
VNTVHIIQGVTKRALQLWKSILIYTEDVHNVLNCNNVARHCKFDACGTIVHNTATAPAPAIEIKMAAFTGAERARLCFGSKKRSLLHKFKRNVALSMARNHPVGLQLTHDTRILLRLDALYAIPSYPISHVFLTLQWNSRLERASLQVHESQRDVRLGKLVFQMLHSRECYENVCT